MRLEHLIAGERRPGGGAVELRAAFGKGPTCGHLPRAGRGELNAALDGLHAPAAAPPRRVLLDALARYESDPEPQAATAVAAGLAVDELVPHVQGCARRVERELPRAPGASPGVALVVPHWSELFVGAAHAVLHELARGRAVLLLPDPRLPFAADALVSALLAAGVPEASLALLHGAEEELFLAAVGSTRVRAAVVSAERKRIAAVRRVGESRAGLEQTLDLPRSRAESIGAGDDLARCARATLVEAFGRGRTFSGQLPGQLARLFVARCIFAEFGEELLAAYDSDADVADPLPPVDQDAARRWRATLGLGLDEGATLVRGEEEYGAGPRPAIFTNVEAASRLARRPYPAPVLALVRGA